MNQDELKHSVWYEPISGIFRWRNVEAKNRKLPWSIAGSRHGCGYIQMQLNGKKYLAHRLAWLYQTGCWPEGDIDHINGVRNDNRWANLRDVSHSENLQNQRTASKANKFGLLGVVLNKDGSITAQIKTRGVITKLGAFSSPEEAHAAYLKAKAQQHPTAPINGGTK